MKTRRSMLACSALAFTAAAQDPTKPVLRAGVSVQMPAAPHAVAMPDADAENAVVVAITADGKVYQGTTRTEPAAISDIKANTVYVKADARAPYATVLAVLDALHGKSIGLLAAAPGSVPKADIMPPYGVRLTMSR